MATVVSWNEIRDRARKFSGDWKDETRESGEYQTFWNEFFEIFGVKRRSLAIYQENVKKLSGAQGFIDLFWTGKLIAEHKSAGQSLDSAFVQATGYVEALPETHRPRYIIVTDYARMRLYDLEGDTGVLVEDFPLEELSKRARLFGFIAGYEVRKYREEDPVNRKAVKVVVNLYNALAKSNYPRESLEKLLVRLVFCFFADDAGIFPPGEPFKYYLVLGSNEDGSDFGSRLESVFSTLNTSIENRQTTLEERLAELPYVNGGLFSEYLPTVFFNREMRRAVLDACDFNWAAVSPAIFGSMFQFVTDVQNADARHDLGAHYTSEKNILKVVDGLFMDDLRTEFNLAGKNSQKLEMLREKMGKISLLDPACGCGNFLVVAYRELRRLELEILKRLHPGTKNIEDGQITTGLEMDAAALSKLSVERMYGIEISSFPAEIARLSLWLTDHLANIELGDYFGKPFIKLPLKESPHITCADALEIDWETVVPKHDLTFILGNPPFLGSKVMSDAQRAQIVKLFSDEKGAGTLDFVTGWYIKAAKYMQGTHVHTAFVSTNSVTQGEQVGILWSALFKLGIQIQFAHRTFKWSNEASGRAAVYCVIIGFAPEISTTRPKLYEYAEVAGEPHEVQVTNINPYLVDAANIVVRSRQKPLSDAPAIGIGNKPVDGGLYLFTTEERDAFLEREPTATLLFRRWIGADEFLNGGERWCLWLGETAPEVLAKLPEVKRRIEAVRQWRLLSKSAPTRKLAETPTHFHVENMPKGNYLIIPEVSSERRKYIPIGFEPPETLASNLVKIVPEATLYHFGILESEMHMEWMRAVSGRLESRYRYSKDIVYNNFPWPTPTDKQRKVVEAAAQIVLDTRLNHPRATLSDLYDPNTMPKDLLESHHVLDRAVDACYNNRSFGSTSERLEFLFERYKALVMSPASNIN